MTPSTSLRTGLLLASQSSGRAAMFRAAGLTFETSAAHVDEEALTASLLDAGQTPRNVADALAEAKAVKISSRLPRVTVIGADSTLALDDGSMLSKPESPDEAADHLRRMAGTRHRLFSAAVAARVEWTSGAVFAAYSSRSPRAASRPKKRSTAASCSTVVVAALASCRSSDPPASSAVYQPRCLRAMRTPDASP